MVNILLVALLQVILHLFALIGNVHVANAVKKYELHEFAFLVLEIVP